MATITTTATVRVMRSIDYGNYETELTIENPEGLTDSDFHESIQKCHELTNHSLGIYIRAKYPDKRQGVIKGGTEVFMEQDPEEEARVMSMPEWKPTDKPAKKALRKVKS